MEGFIILHRKLLEWEWFHKPNILHVFIYCLLKANFQDKNWQGIIVKRGEFVTSVNTICKATGLTIKQVRNALDKLKLTKEISVNTSNKHSVVSVCNYETYQVQGQTKGKQRANKGQQLNNNNKDNNNKLLLSYTIDLEFEKFWNLYDKKIDTKKCKIKFSKLTDLQRTKIFETLNNYILATPNKQYRKLPLTYLNGECWNDEIINNTGIVKIGTNKTNYELKRDFNPSDVIKSIERFSIG